MASALGTIAINGEVTESAFVQVPMAVLQCSDLTMGPRLVYAALLWYDWETGRYPGHAQVAEDFGISPSTLRKHLKKLEEVGLIESIQQGLGKTNSYTVRIPTGPSKSSVQNDNSGRSSRQKSADPYNDSDSVGDLTTKRESSVLRFEKSSFENKDELVETVADTFARTDEVASVCCHLRKFSTEVIRQAAQITADKLPVKNPIAYLYGVLKNLDDECPSYHQPAGKPVGELEPEERRRSHQTLAEVTEAFYKSLELPEQEAPKTDERAMVAL